MDIDLLIQFEVLAKLADLWRSRIDGCPDAPVLEFQTLAQGDKGIEYVFTLVSGNLDMSAADKDKSFYDYLLVQDESSDDQIPVEALFDDLKVSGLVFPLNKYTRSKWGEQHPTVQAQLQLADLRDINTDGRKTQVVLRTWGGLKVKFEEGYHYRISPRMVDFNITKVLSTLVELDFQCVDPNDMYDIDPGRVPFLQVILDPRSLRTDLDHKQSRNAGQSIQRLFKRLQDLDVDSASPLVLKASQNRAAQQILSNRLSVIWGPPGDCLRRLYDLGRYLYFSQAPARHIHSPYLCYGS